LVGASAESNRPESASTKAEFQPRSRAKGNGRLSARTPKTQETTEPCLAPSVLLEETGAAIMSKCRRFHPRTVNPLDESGMADVDY